MVSNRALYEAFAMFDVNLCGLVTSQIVFAACL